MDCLAVCRELPSTDCASFVAKQLNPDEMRWSTTRECAKFFLMPTAVLSCVFDCHDPAPCGGEVEFVNASLVDGEWNAVDGKIRKPEDYEDDIHP